MSAQPPAVRLRAMSPTVARARKAAAPTTDQWVRRRLACVWALLFFNVLGHPDTWTMIPLYSSVGRMLTMGSLGLALLLGLSLNRRVVFRPNALLALYTALGVISLVIGLHAPFAVSSTFRAARLLIFVAVLWLTTPWWGRDDFLVCRIHRRVLLVLLSTVLIGLVLAPGPAFEQATGGRLGGVVWPMPPTQVGHYAGVFTGLTIILWFSKRLSARSTVLPALLGFTILILTHTRTALLGLVLGVVVAGLSLFTRRRKVRSAFAIVFVILAFSAPISFPVLNEWFARGQSSQEIGALTGRAKIWAELVAAPRTKVEVFFGTGMSNDSFDGLPIDSSWLSTYVDQGLVGDVIIGLALAVLLLLALLSPRGPTRALVLFLTVYCIVASYTESGLGDASTYLLDLSVAMSLLMTPLVPSALSLEE